ncbi:hypothetical protein SAMN04488137_1770 [Fictibacillus solisalsi]|uniref:Transcriptional regulator n=1 Tax=Fictibacillus solisalsi TaxID=459525 RepID=A0A1G9VT03_9BACL|nr:hypothetical protein [Fictibacillus solisalsi]SDM75187.1 hypothetical protein SAMN04488137_1770 [Fictibacillus solisalsi]
MYQIGVVGPKTSVDRILTLAKKMDKNLRFLPFPYNHFLETSSIVKENNDQVDIWLFSGKLSYMIAKKIKNSDEQLVHIQHTEASLYRCFLHTALDHNVIVERVSIDELEETNIEDALEQLNVPVSNVYIKRYGMQTNPNELLKYHLSLWEEGMIDVSITCFEGVYKGLIEAGVPAYWYTPTTLEIQQTMRILEEKVRAFYFKDTQISVGIIDINDFDKIAEKARSPYRLQYLETRLKESLIGLSESLDGSLMERGNGRYVIFSSRGANERNINMLVQTVDQLSLESGSSIAVGIGYGETVFAAEVNALSAMQWSKERGDYGIVIIQEDGQIIESAGKIDELTYSYRLEDKDFLKKLEQGNVSVRMYSKLAAIVRRMGLRSFTTKEIATHLRLDERNVRRMVTSLTEVGLAEYMGSEGSASRGRPSKIYRLT